MGPSDDMTLQRLAMTSLSAAPTRDRVLAAQLVRLLKNRKVTSDQRGKTPTARLSFPAGFTYWTVIDLTFLVEP